MQGESSVRLGQANCICNGAGGGAGTQNLGGGAGRKKIQDYTKTLLMTLANNPNVYHSFQILLY